MDSIPCTDRSKETCDPSHDSVLRINSDSNIEISKSNMALPLEPVTPDSIKEIGDNLNSSPLTGLNKTRKAICFDTDSIDINGSPRTPSNVVFDPFAPGAEDKVLAPQCKKATWQHKLIVSRRLDFDSSVDVLKDRCNGEVSLSDEEMIESVYENLLRVIISMQTKGFVADPSGDGCRTPPLAPRVDWVAETCPGAPVKRAGKSRNVDLGLCRKIEF